MSAEPDRVHGLESLTRLLTRDVEHQAKQLGDQREEIVAMLAEVFDRLDTLEGTDAASRPAKAPRPWAARASAEDWSMLTDWVDWLTTTYSLTEPLLIPPCWPAHPGVVEELAGLHAAWRNAMLTAGKAGDAGTDAAVYFHAHHLGPTLERVRRGYATQACVDGHQPDPNRDRWRTRTPGGTDE